MSWWPLFNRRERLRREASRWIARRHDAQDGEGCAAFERWYRADPDHAAAYDRLSTLFETAGRVRLQSTGPSRAHPVSRRPYALAGALAGVCVVVLVVTVIVTHHVGPSLSQGVQTEVVSATDAAPRDVRLADGSQVVLAPGTELRVRLDGEERRMELTRGEGRFTVVHDGRPFVVAAHGAEVVARGTQFVVRLGARGTLVSLIEGRVDVFYPMKADRAARSVATLVRGQQLLVPVEPQRTRRPTGPQTASAPTAMIDLDDVGLGEAADRVAGRVGRRIRLADPALARLRVTGAFRAGDAEGFARSVAIALNLQIERAPDGTLWLRPPRLVHR